MIVLSGSKRMIRLIRVPFVPRDGVYTQTRSGFANSYESATTRVTNSAQFFSDWLNT
jgi:hypothetical protein